jgi:hypothetical protein
MFRIKLVVFAVLAAALALPEMIRAQVTVPTDVFKINYFDNTGVADSTVRIINPGSDFTDRCAMIYVFSPDQQLKECCGCKITPNGLLKLSVQANLTAKPANGVTFTAGAIEIFSTPTAPALPFAPLPGPPGSSPQCNPGDPTFTPLPALRAWGSHVQDLGAITETEFLDAPLGSSTILQTECLFIEGAAIAPITLGGSGSGQGLCNCTNQLTGAIDP